MSDLPPSAAASDEQVKQIKQAAMAFFRHGDGPAFEQDLLAILREGGSSPDEERLEFLGRLMSGAGNMDNYEASPAEVREYAALKAKLRSRERAAALAVGAPPAPDVLVILRDAYALLIKHHAVGAMSQISWGMECPVCKANDGNKVFTDIARVLNPPEWIERVEQGVRFADVEQGIDNSR